MCVWLCPRLCVVCAYVCECVCPPERVPSQRGALLDTASFEAEDVPALTFLTSNLCRVEIARNNALHRVYFPRPILTNYLTEKTREETLWNLPRDSPGEKVNGLFSAANDLYDEMEHQVCVCGVCMCMLCAPAWPGYWCCLGKRRLCLQL